MAKRVVVDHANHILEMLRDVCAERGMRCYSNPGDLAYAKDWNEAHVTLTSLNKDGKPHLDMAYFKLQQMPGCCAILTMSYVEYRKGKFEFRDAVEYVEEAARRAAFGSMVLTQVLYKPEAPANDWYSIVALNGFKMSKPFINAKSGNRVVYLTKNLGQVGKMDGFEDEVQQ